MGRLLPKPISSQFILSLPRENIKKPFLYPLKTLKNRHLSTLHFQIIGGGGRVNKKGVRQIT